MDRMLPLLLMVFLAASCEKGSTPYEMPEDDYVYVDVVASSEPEVHTEVIQNQMRAADKMEQWQEWRNRYEAADKYDAYTKAWTDTSEDDIEAELESYCDSLFSNSCILNMNEYCDRTGCRTVSVECKRARDTDDVCLRHDISIGDYIQ